MAAEVSPIGDCDRDEMGDVEAWLAGLGRKVAVDDLTPELMGAAMRWLRDHESGFEWLVQVKDRLLATGGLSMREVTGVLNCWRAELLRMQRNRQASAAKTIDEAVDLRPVPPGRYAVKQPDGHVVFYQVEHGRGRWAGYTFLQQVVGGGHLQYVGRVAPGRLYRGGRRLDLAEIAEDPEAAARLFGRELGICAVCGRSLTDDDSRTAGIGPRCALRFARMQVAGAGGQRNRTTPARHRAQRRRRDWRSPLRRSRSSSPRPDLFRPTTDDPDAV